MVAAGIPVSARAADLELPRQIPAAKIVQQVGLTEITVDYECPPVRGRKIWGGLVPYDRPWTIGASSAAQIKFSKDVTIDDKPVAAGTYWLLATPGKTAWTLMLNKSASPLATVADYRPDLDVVRIKALAKPIAKRERLAVSFSDMSDERASLDLEWDTLRVSLPIRMNTTQQMRAAIGDLDNAWRSFANAARYMLEVEKNYDAGLKYIDESLALRNDWYSLWVKGALLAGKGRFVEAAELAENAHELAQKTGNGAYLEPDLLKAIGDWRRRGHLLEKEGKAIAKAAPEKEPAVDAASKQTSPAPIVSDHAVAPTPPVAAPTVPTVPTTTTTTTATAKPPVGDPPLRRARLRRR